MAELQVLTDRIRRAAEEKAAWIAAEAKAQYDQMLAACKENGEQEKVQIIEAAKKEAEQITTRAISASAQKNSQESLALKMAMIEDTIEKAKQKFLAADTEVYMERLGKLLDAKVQSGCPEGEIMLNAKDKAAVTKAFKAKLKDYNLSVSEQAADIDGGFILIYGKVEENCAVEAIFREHYEQLVDFIGANLF